mmetsp:Transcript_33871/g.39087  ORF Transcript_33871/g.39087 Transcript_33871/m.39087 type:complete len:124 (+) Transcript_33871:12-383(+)
MSRRSRKNINMTSGDTEEQRSSSNYFPILEMKQRKPFCNKKRWITFAIVLVLIIAIAVAVALVVLLKSSDGKIRPDENGEPINMFKVASQKTQSNKLSFELESKIEKANNGDRKCVNTSVGRI